MIRAAKTFSFLRISNRARPAFWTGHSAGRPSVVAPVLDARDIRDSYNLLLIVVSFSRGYCYLASATPTLSQAATTAVRASAP